jgi:ABC-type transport system substrate-binding protein
MASVPAGSGNPLPTIVEQTIPDDDAAVAALTRGEIDVLERVPPWQVERLRGTKGVRVDTYRLPTVHTLIPNMKRPLMAAREFRRALCYAIDRQRAVQEVLLGGGKVPGFDVLSGPFPTGTSLSDPLRYAYNNQLTPRAFEPRLAAVLSTVAWAGVLDPEHKGLENNSDVEPKEMSEVVLAHPADPVARVTCETIKLQLERAQIPVRLVEFTADQLQQGKVDYDLRYTELAVWEPVVDARTLLGPGGVASEDSPVLDASLRKLDRASNWKDVRAALAEIHDIANHDLPLIPLWQTVNYFAYRTDVHGIGESPIVLYQNIDQWAFASSDSSAQRDTKP